MAAKYHSFTVLINISKYISRSSNCTTNSLQLHHRPEASLACRLTWNASWSRPSASNWRPRSIDCTASTTCVSGNHNSWQYQTSQHAWLESAELQPTTGICSIMQHITFQLKAPTGSMLLCSQWLFTILQTITVYFSQNRLAASPSIPRLSLYLQSKLSSYKTTDMAYTAV